jgi:hypothetical protein
MPRNLSDEEYNYLQSRRQVADFVESIYNDPNLNKEAKALIKRKYPNLQIPDYDIENRVNARLDAERTEREQAEMKKRQTEDDERFAKLRKKTQDDYGFTDDAMNRLEQMMIDRNIGDYEAAAALMASKEPRTSEPTYDNTHWQHEKREGFAEIAKDPEAWGRNELLKAMRLDQERERGGR